MANIMDELRSTPLWVKVFGIIVIVLALVLGILLLTGVGGDHGPGRHAPVGDTSPIERSDGPDGHAPPIQHGA